jgi:hypothetical protein
MAQHARLKIEAGVRVYFCDPHSPWQRGTNENTNGLLRQDFPKGADLSMHSANEIAAVAAALNSRPRKTLDWKTPAEALDRFLLSPIATGGPPITEPRIYFGQGSPGYVIVKTSTPEFDYPKGKDNAYARYDGADGIPIGGIGPVRLAYGGPQHPAQRLHHQREQDPASSQHQGSRGDDRAVPSARSRPLRGALSHCEIRSR